MDPLMQKWWCWLVEQFPLYVAPNLITILGLFINIITSLLLVYYSPHADQEVPRWACLVCCLGLFAYQSMDAIDGKQARRTGTSTPLGELFDHGCDSVSTVFVSISVCCAVQLGTAPYWLFCQCIMAVTLFYCAHWQTYVSGKLRFGYIDVTEAQFGVMAILLISGVLGSGWWSTETRLGPSPREIYYALCLTYSAYKFYTAAPIILHDGCGKNGSSISGTSVLSPLLPLLMYSVPAVMVAWKSSQDIFLANPVLYMLTFGFVAARVTNRLVVAHMTKHEMAYTDSSMLGPGALLLNQYFNTPVSEYWLLWAVCAYVTFDLVAYCRRVCLEICESLEIELFRIPSPAPSPASANGSPPKPGHQPISASKYDTRSKTRPKHS